MTFPSIVALDTDWTTWHGYLDYTTWGKGSGAVSPVEDNIEQVDAWNLRDKTNYQNTIAIYNQISSVINHVLDNGAKLAIVSRNDSKAMCDRALYLFTVTRSQNQVPIINLATYDEIVNESIVEHFRRIKSWSGNDVSDMLLFSAWPFNNSVRIELGISFQVIRDTENGLSWGLYCDGLNTWGRDKAVTIPSSPSGTTPVLVGYSGLSTYWIDLIKKGEGTVDTTTPYRWGYALYITDIVSVAKFFCDWDRGAPWYHDSYVCEIWVKDFAKWQQINKIWVPQDPDLEMNNMTWSVSDSARNQEDRDLYIANQWGVPTPYVLFSNHHSMPDLGLNVAFHEMVIYTQVQRALFDVVKLSDTDVSTRSDPPYFHNQIQNWNIVVASNANVLSY